MYRVVSRGISETDSCFLLGLLNDQTCIIISSGKVLDETKMVGQEVRQLFIRESLSGLRNYYASTAAYS